MHYIAGVTDWSKSLIVVGRRIRRRRERLGLSRRELAEVSGISERYIAQVEAGLGNLSLSKLFALAESVRTTAEELVAGAHGGAFPIAFVGLRGAGKSTVGKRVASKLGRRFVEVDAEIEAVSGLSLASIFSLHGEAYYDQLQREVLRRLIEDGSDLVMAVGGSVVRDIETFEHLLTFSTVVWLKAEPKVHWDRVLAQGDTRPMEKNPQAFNQLKSILKKREPFYKKADLVVDTTQLEADVVAEKVSVSLRNV